MNIVLCVKCLSKIKNDTKYNRMLITFYKTKQLQTKKNNNNFYMYFTYLWFTIDHAGIIIKQGDYFNSG